MDEKDNLDLFAEVSEELEKEEQEHRENIDADSPDVMDDTEKEVAEESEDTDNKESAEEIKTEKPFSWKEEILSWVKMLVVAFLIAVVLDRFIIVNATVPTGSMENTIMTGSRMMGFRFSYWFSEPERGDIVVFKYPLNEKENYVKRIIGLPGEAVRIADGKIYIFEDGDTTKEPTVLDEDYIKGEWVIRSSGYDFTIPEDCYLMLGDNRNYSADARVWKEMVETNNRNNQDNPIDEDIIYVHKDKILGKAIFTYWPLDNIKLLK